MGTDTGNNKREWLLPVFSLDTYFNPYHTIQICQKNLNQPTKSGASFILQKPHLSSKSKNLLVEYILVRTRFQVT